MNRPILVAMLYLQLAASGLSARQYVFRDYTPENGLSNQVVHTVTLDSAGYLWVGTAAGLNRFNGYRFSTYKSLAGDSTSLSSNVINHVYTDRRSRLWIATFTGLCLYNRGRDDFSRIPLYADGRLVREYECLYVTEGKNRRLFAGLHTWGLCLYDEVRHRLIPAGERLTGAARAVLREPQLVSGFLEDVDGSWWIATPDRILHVGAAGDSVTVVPCRLPSGERIHPIRIFCDAASSDDLWIGTWGDGLVRYRKRTGTCTSIRFQEGMPKNISNIVFDLCPRGDTELWLATNAGILRCRAGTGAVIGPVRDPLHAEAVVNTEAECLYAAGSSLWIGTKAGLCSIDEERQKFFSDPVWTDCDANTLVEDTLTGRWYGLSVYYRRALLIFDPATGRQLRIPVPAADQLMAEPFSLLLAGDGEVWIGTTRGIYRYREGSPMVLARISASLQQPDRSVCVTNMTEDGQHNIWFACNGKGLMKYDCRERRFIGFFRDPGAAGSWPIVAINSLRMAGGDTLLACGNYEGVVRMNVRTGTWTHYDAQTERYAALKQSTDVLADAVGNLWISTVNNGLVRLDTSGRIRTFERDDAGEIVDEQENLSLDRSGMLWIVTKNALYRFDPAATSFMRFMDEPGIPSGSIHHGLFAASRGRFAYLSHRTVYRFDPAAVATTPRPLRVVLEAVTVDGPRRYTLHPRDAATPLRLQHEENNLTLQFAALNFLNPAATRYSYFLEGNAGAWSAPGTHREIRFAQLKPGQYRFWVKASVTRPAAAPPQLLVVIDIVPAWWQTAWFSWLAAVAAVAATVLLFRGIFLLRYRRKIARLERQREIENIRSRISRDIHDEIGSGLTRIKLMTRSLQREKQPADADSVTGRIASTSDELIRNLGEIVWTINPANDSLANVVAYIRRYLYQLFEDNPSVRLHLDLPEPSDALSASALDPDVKRDLVLVLKEAVNNVLKHAEAGQVHVSLRCSGTDLELTVTDDGKGIGAGPAAGAGNGLLNMRRRMEALKGRIEITSTPGAGTTVRCTVRLGASGNTH